MEDNFKRSPRAMKLVIVQKIDKICPTFKVILHIYIFILTWLLLLLFMMCTVYINKYNILKDVQN